MPTLPLPPDAPICGGDLPVTDDADVAAQEPFEVRKSQNGPVRDAIRAGNREMQLRYQRAAEIAAAQASTRRATSIYLDGLGEERKVYRQPGESNKAYRNRINNPETPVTPEAICKVANDILAPFTSIQCKYFESILDRWYVNDGTPSWHAYVNVTPTYQERLYVDDSSENGGVYIANRDPGALWTFADQVGRFFVLRVPDLAPLLDDGNNFVFNGAADSPQNQGFGFWVQDGTSADVASFIGPSGTAIDVYQAIVNAVSRLIGASIRWMLYADPNLQ